MSSELVFSSGDSIAFDSVRPPIRKPHFVTLDAARGIAAIAVMIHHIGLENGSNILRRGFFAVDFFLILSGFVIALSYDRKLRGDLSFNGFMKLRIARLWPMVVLGGILAIAAYATNPQPDVSGWALAFQFALIPIVTGGLLFPANPPLWSLLYEIAANGVHALLLARLSLRQLTALFLALVAIDFAILALHHFWAAGFTIAQAPYAVARILTGYVMGMLMFRLYQGGQLPKIKAPFYLPLLLILVPLLVPKILSERIVAVLALGCVFPAAMLLGINNPCPARWQSAMKWLGGISFPLYITHMPIIHLWQSTGLFDHSTRYGWLVWSLPVITAIAAAAVFERFYDLPLRTWLKARSQGVTRIG
ncbi:acyltransferase [Sphingomonas sanguinis]|uniref:acyltransferase family protein n=1 Tax=Sphingomonas sp. LC-1 TaxID=3110957 RepID=UPI0021BAE327|nr:acyltransferase [Sphingomonas sp. LC-1]MCT8001226.1 acyltransferase [Sphingomonas sp. LC-1]